MRGRWQTHVGWARTGPRIGPRRPSAPCRRSSPCGKRWSGRGRGTSACSARVLRRDGVRVPSGGAATFGQRVQALPLSATQARLLVPLVALLSPLNRQLAALEAPLARGVAAHAAARRLCTVPGVGPVTPAAVVALLDDVSR